MKNMLLQEIFFAPKFPYKNALCTHLFDYLLDASDNVLVFSFLYNVE